MPNYEEIIQQSQLNVIALSEKLKELDKLHEDIKKLIKQPEIFDAKYQEIVKLAESYTNSIGAATKKYLDGNNTLFISKLSELSSKISELGIEITRLANTDFNKLFEDLQITFIEQTRKDLEIELKKFDDKSKDIQTKIEKLKEQINRLEKIDLETHFDKLQKTLSDIYGSIGSVNLSLATISQTLVDIVQSLGVIQNAIVKAFSETKQVIEEFGERIENHLTKQDVDSKRNTEQLKNQISMLAKENEALKRMVKSNNIIQLIFFVFIIIALGYLILMK